MNLLVTGGAGFIGSHFIRRMLGKGGRVINLDALTYAGDKRRLADIEDNPRYTFIHGDICDEGLVNRVFSEYSISAVVNFAAESHVDRSIDDPGIFVKTNVLGTQTLLDAAKNHWSVRPGDRYCREYKDGARFLQISTDEVYGALGDTGYFTESSPIEPSSPYSASKAAAEMLATAYYKTYGLPVVVTRCSNNYGPWQTPEKLIPLMIKNALEGKKLPVYGDGLQVRDWIHVEDHCAAAELVLHKGKPGEAYNVGGGGEKTNIEIVRAVLHLLDKDEDMIEHVEDRPGHDKRYAIDSTKLQVELGWRAEKSFDEGLRETVEWYAKNMPLLINSLNI